ncbi:hypothetical protein [Burkholderia pseudomultivorans]|uniref:hypothetical protein n=1 Tax=Burkholderia pseudomultivorans TaxID=1207504 RepID=UPI0007576D17|nr:hypothetical protein [Burkholderia pseudomultivorans]KVG66125.1 hypothetical protein WS80_09090 [Burkholderia pseudomultivorans]
MDFENRIKKEMTEGIVKAILEDAGYRVIDSGIEKIIRELSCLPSFEYAKLAYPDAMSRLPDFTVMTKDQDEKYSVQLKYEDDRVWRHYWKAVDDLKEDSPWWAMSQLDKVFPLLKDRKLDAQNSLDSAIKALSGILK